MLATEASRNTRRLAARKDVRDAVFRSLGFHAASLSAESGAARRPPLARLAACRGALALPNLHPAGALG